MLLSGFVSLSWLGDPGAADWLPMLSLRYAFLGKDWLLFLVT